MQSAVDLYWIPVAAGTPRLQRLSLRLWEAFEAARCRRPRAVLYHSALKLRLENGDQLTLELTPAFAGEPVAPLATGPVGFRGADRFRLLRYQLRCLPGAELPDECWAVDSPVHLADRSGAARRILDVALTVPRHVWGRRVPGTNEMWTSDSTLSWILERAGIDLSGAAPPSGGRAPGWQVGIQLARSREQP